VATPKTKKHRVLMKRESPEATALARKGVKLRGEHRENFGGNARISMRWFSLGKINIVRRDEGAVRWNFLRTRGNSYDNQMGKMTWGEI